MIDYKQSNKYFDKHFRNLQAIRNYRLNGLMNEAEFYWGSSPESFKLYSKVCNELESIIDANCDNKKLLERIVSKVYFEIGKYLHDYSILELSEYDKLKDVDERAINYVRNTESGFREFNRWFRELIQLNTNFKIPTDYKYDFVLGSNKLAGKFRFEKSSFNGANTGLRELIIMHLAELTKPTPNKKYEGLSNKEFSYVVDTTFKFYDNNCEIPDGLTSIHDNLLQLTIVNCYRNLHEATRISYELKHSGVIELIQGLFYSLKDKSNENLLKTKKK